MYSFTSDSCKLFTAYILPGKRKRNRCSYHCSRMEHRNSSFITTRFDASLPFNFVAPATGAFARKIIFLFLFILYFGARHLFFSSCYFAVFGHFFLKYVPTHTLCIHRQCTYPTSYTYTILPLFPIALRWQRSLFAMRRSLFMLRLKCYYVISYYFFRCPIVNCAMEAHTRTLNSTKLFFISYSYLDFGFKA